MRRGRGEDMRKEEDRKTCLSREDEEETVKLRKEQRMGVGAAWRSEGGR